ncbi:MAG: trans-aconitate 2-methyltransferase [Frankiales bacterium]|jgi:trans-aconitate 2-methyltransferase|nr:trans-aconitate 2-methyltransferase [Frankiales bacterium]
MSPTNDWDAHRYDTLPLPHLAWGEGVVRRLPLTGVRRVLDVCCGTGRDALLLLETHPGLTVVGVDASLAMLGASSERLAAYDDRVELLRLDLRDAEPLARPCDAAMSVAGLHWLPDHDRVFAWLAASLMPGARFSGEWGGEGNIAAVRAALDELGLSDDAAWNFPPAELTAQRLEHAGFTDITATLRPAPAVFARPEELLGYLETVVLGRQVADRTPEERADLAAQVASRLPGGVVDYVRLEVTARRR